MVIKGKTPQLIASCGYGVLFSTLHAKTTFSKNKLVLPKPKITKDEAGNTINAGSYVNPETRKAYSNGKYTIVGLQLCDWDYDGKNDLIYINNDREIFWHKNVATNTRPKFATENKSILKLKLPNFDNNIVSFRLADMNGDGLLDILVGHRSNGIDIYFNKGTKKQAKFDIKIKKTLVSFPKHNIHDIGSLTISVADLNSDKKLDVLVSGRILIREPKTRKVVDDTGLYLFYQK